MAKQRLEKWTFSVSIGQFSRPTEFTFAIDLEQKLNHNLCSLLLYCNSLQKPSIEFRAEKCDSLWSVISVTVWIKCFYWYFCDRFRPKKPELTQSGIFLPNLIDCFEKLTGSFMFSSLLFRMIKWEIFNQMPW